MDMKGAAGEEIRNMLLETRVEGIQLYGGRIFAELVPAFVKWNFVKDGLEYLTEEISKQNGECNLISSCCLKYNVR